MSNKRGRPPVLGRLEEISHGLRQVSDMLNTLVERIDKLERRKAEEQPKDTYQPRFDRWGN